MRIIHHSIYVCGKEIDTNMQHMIALGIEGGLPACTVSGQLRCWTGWSYAICDRVVDSVVSVLSSKVSN